MVTAGSSGMPAAAGTGDSPVHLYASSEPHCPLCPPPPVGRDGERPGGEEVSQLCRRIEALQIGQQLSLRHQRIVVETMLDPDEAAALWGRFMYEYTLRPAYETTNPRELAVNIRLDDLHRIFAPAWWRNDIVLRQAALTCPLVSIPMPYGPSPRVMSDATRGSQLWQSMLAAELLLLIPYHSSLGLTVRHSVVPGGVVPDLRATAPPVLMVFVPSVLRVNPPVFIQRPATEYPFSVVETDSETQHLSPLERYADVPLPDNMLADLPSFSLRFSDMFPESYGRIPSAEEQQLMDRHVEQVDRVMAARRTSARNGTIGPVLPDSAGGLPGDRGVGGGVDPGSSDGGAIL